MAKLIDSRPEKQPPGLRGEVDITLRGSEIYALMALYNGVPRTKSNRKHFEELEVFYEVLEAAERDLEE